MGTLSRNMNKSLTIIVFACLVVNRTFGYSCSNTSWASGPRVGQIDSTSVWVAWDGLLIDKLGYCSDKLHIKYYPLEEPNNYKAAFIWDNLDNIYAKTKTIIEGLSPDAEFGFEMWSTHEKEDGYRTGIYFEYFRSPQTNIFIGRDFAEEPKSKDL